MEAPKTPPTQTEGKPLGAGWAAALGGLSLIPMFLLFIFHSGAAYLSYQKFHSAGWAFVDFIFAYFYYPYYAFFLSSVPVPAPGMMGGSLAKMLGKLIK